MSAPAYLKIALRHTQFNGFDSDRILPVQAQRKCPLLAQSGLTAGQGPL